MQEPRISTAPYAVVVDDNPVILLYATEVLTSAGFSVFAAADTAEALAWFERHGEAIVLLFTNVELGEAIDGFTLARHISEHWPTTGIVVSSGQLLPQTGDMPAGAAFLPKPFVAGDVVARAREVIEHKQSALLRDGALAL